MAKPKTKAASSSKAKKNIYPAIKLPLVKNPIRFYALPILGGVVKLFMLIPVFVWVFILGIVLVLLSLINSLVVLFTGVYWKPAYEVTTLFIHLSAKISYFFLGLTNTYPGFDGVTPDFSLEIPYPKNPNRFFAFPLLGGLARVVLLIPYIIYTSVMQYAGHLAAVIASFPVFFSGKYPESLYELGRDSVRLNLSSNMYFSGLSDKYPSFWISMKHKEVKIILIILASILFLLNTLGRHQSQSSYQRYHYQTPTNSSY